MQRHSVSNNLVHHGLWKNSENLMCTDQLFHIFLHWSMQKGVNAMGIAWIMALEPSVGTSLGVLLQCVAKVAHFAKSLVCQSWVLLMGYICNL
jgi:hypothetical protein